MRKILFILTIASGWGKIYSANITWIAPAASNWNNTANWSTGTVPGTTDIAIFDGTSVQDCSIDAAVSVQGIQISNYTGIISQNNFTIIVGTSNYSQNSGTFNGGSANITFNGANGTTAINLSGGTFNSTSATLTVTNRATIQNTGGTFNGGTGIITNNGVFSQTTAGTFNATSGIWNQKGTSFIFTGGTFNHNNGTIIFSTRSMSFDGSPVL
jgi:hypothetical protein